MLARAPKKPKVGVKVGVKSAPFRPPECQKWGFKVGPLLAGGKPPSLSGCSGRSAPRPSSSSRTAPFGADPPPSCQPLARQPARARAKRVSCHTSSCHPHSSGDELGGSAELRRAAALCRPALLDGAAQPLQAEAGGRLLLVDPLAPGVLRGRGADLQAGWPRRELRAGEAAAPRSCARSRH